MIRYPNGKEAPDAFGADAAELARQIIAYRQAHKMSRAGLAVRLLVDREAVASWETCKKRPHPRHLALLEKLLAAPTGSKG